jgi:hypothetical protein
MDDRQLLAMLRGVIGVDPEPATNPEPAPSGVLDAALAAWSWRTIDEELVALAYDSAGDTALAGVRGEAGRYRQLTFESGETTLEVELADRQLLGQFLPPRRVRVRLSTPDGAREELDSDERGRFRVVAVPPAVFRLSYHAEEGRWRSTGWILP